VGGAVEGGGLGALLVGYCGLHGIAGGLREVVREYARAPFRVPPHEHTDWLAERVAEIEDLCLLIGARAAGRAVPEAGAVVVAERLTAMLALAVIARRALAVAVARGVGAGGAGAARGRGAGRPPLAPLPAL